MSLPPSPTASLYAYVVVVLLPINSAINPWLYTFTTGKFRAQVRRFLASHGVCGYTQHRIGELTTATRVMLH